jgi:hypothetical protein
VGKFYDNETEKYYFITQGDNLNTNPRTDPPGTDLEIPVPEDKIIGVVIFRIPKLGWIKIWLAGSPGLSLVLILGLSILLVISLVHEVNNSKEEGKDDESEEELDEFHDNFTSFDTSGEEHSIDQASDSPSESTTNSDL